MGKSRVKLDLNDCPACGACIRACPAGALTRPAGSIQESFRRFALAAKAVMHSFGQGNVLCVNSLVKVSERCDCSTPSPFLCKDLGYLADPNPLRIDVESARLLRSEDVKLDWPSWEMFENIASAVMK